MKRILIFTLLIMTLACSSSTAESDSPKPDKVALVIIIDTSWSCNDDLPQFRTLTTQSAGGLTPGDYFEIISADAAAPKIRHAQTIKTGNTEEIKAIASAVEGIRSKFLKRADTAKALDLAFKRLDSQEGFAATAAIIFTDGKLAANEITDVLRLAAQFKQKGRPLYLTGTKGTNKELLIAANQGKLRWSLLSEANPQMWLQKEIRPEYDQKTIELGPETKHILETEGPAGEKTVPDEQSVQEPEMTLHIRMQPEIILPWEEPFLFQHQPTDQIKAQLPLAEEANELSLGPATEAEDGVTPEPREKQALWAKLRRPIGIAAVLASIAISITFVVLVMAGRRQASDWDKKIGTKLKNLSSQDTGVLIAKLNGHVHHLGRIRHLREIHIGSGPKNTIRIQDKAISDHHVRIYRSGTNPMLQNVGRAPIAVNGLQVKPREKCRLVLPSILQVNDKTKISLSLIKPKIHSESERNNENVKQ